jgi:hypothetical protein
VVFWPYATGGSGVYTQLLDDELAPALGRAREDPSPIHGLMAAAEALLTMLCRAQGLVASTGTLRS